MVIATLVAVPMRYVFESLAANVAGIRFDPCVDPDVVFQVVLQEKLLAALVAFVVPLHQMVPFHVDLEDRVEGRH